MTPAEKELVDVVLGDATAHGYLGQVTRARRAVLSEREPPETRERALNAARALSAAYAEYMAALQGTSPETAGLAHEIAWKDPA